MLINVYVARPDPDPNPRGGGQLPNPNECNSALMSGTNNIYPYRYIDVNDRGHPLRIILAHRRYDRYMVHVVSNTIHVIWFLKILCAVETVTLKAVKAQLKALWRFVLSF